MANVLCQIRGSKRLMLFPPSDVRYFDFKPGSSSSSTDVFRTLEDPKFAFAHSHEVILQPGDILFLPALWLHAAMPIGRTSISVNVFFRNLASGYASGRDVYGNRDLQAYEKGRQDVVKIAKSFNKLPSDIQGFYIHRLAEELAQMGSLRKR
jgi:tRNA wybutosine-synthesizing protein 4